MADAIIQPIVEGHGEVQAIRVLLESLWFSLPEPGALTVLPPIRQPRSRLVIESHLRAYVELAARKLAQVGATANEAILVLLDADDELPCELGPRVLTAGDGDGDPSGDGDGDPSGDGDGDPSGDGDGDPSGDGDGDGDGDGNCGPVEVCASAPDSDPFQVEALAVVDDCLEVTVAYSGGCEDHDFAACWDESMAESDPVQAWLWLAHDAHDDLCEAWITETRSFELEPLRARWIELYGPGPGVMIVHVGEMSIALDI